MKKPPSNGYGRIEQRIVFSVATEHQVRLQDNVGITPLHKRTSPPRSFYLWRRWSTRRSDDEDIIVELSSILEAENGWQIDWSASIY